MNISKTLLKRIAAVVVIAVIAFLAWSQIQQSYAVSYGHGTVLSDNWWDGLNWMKENTPECAVVATYWDPGHFITSIGERFTVFGGTSQNIKRTLTFEKDLTKQKMDELSVTGKYTYEKFEKNGKTYTNITTARIQDISTTLLTSSEQEAINILDKYDYEDCEDGMYYIASSDLIGKSQWWTYFSTWDPVGNDGKKGEKYVYAQVQITNAEPLEEQNAIKYIYNLDNQGVQKFEIYERNGSLSAFLKQQNSLVKVSELIYYDKNGTLKRNINEDAQMEGAIWLDPSKRVLIYIPKQLKESIFTKLYFFNGENLENFEMVKNWGGEVKLFKVNLNNSTVPY